MTGDGILHRCWIVLILPCGTFHTVGHERFRKVRIDRPILFVFPKETSRSPFLDNRKLFFTVLSFIPTLYPRYLGITWV